MKYILLFCYICLQPGAKTLLQQRHIIATLTTATEEKVFLLQDKTKDGHIEIHNGSLPPKWQNYYCVGAFLVGALFNWPQRAATLMSGGFMTAYLSYCSKPIKLS